MRWGHRPNRQSDDSSAQLPEAVASAPGQEILALSPRSSGRALGVVLEFAAMSTDGRLSGANWTIRGRSGGTPCFRKALPRRSSVPAHHQIGVELSRSGQTASAGADGQTSRDMHPRDGHRRSGGGSWGQDRSKGSGDCSPRGVRPQLKRTIEQFTRVFGFCQLAKSGVSFCGHPCSRDNFGADSLQGVRRDRVTVFGREFLPCSIQELVAVL